MHSSVSQTIGKEPDYGNIKEDNDYITLMTSRQMIYETWAVDDFGYRLEFYPDDQVLALIATNLSDWEEISKTTE